MFFECHEKNISIVEQFGHVYTLYIHDRKQKGLVLLLILVHLVRIRLTMIAKPLTLLNYIQNNKYLYV